MDLALSILAITIAAFGIWLFVRIINRWDSWGKKFSIKLAIVGTWGYLLGVGPGYYAATCGWFPNWFGLAVFYFYEPLFFARNIPPLGMLLNWYLELWLKTMSTAW